MRARKAFTLIELVVAMALLLVFIGMAFGTLSNYLAARTANEQQMILQQNFRSAMERMRYDFAQAGSANPIMSPGSNEVSHVLKFKPADEAGTPITYSLAPGTGTGTYRMLRNAEGNAEAVTEDMHQLVDLYFIRSGGKITVVIIGHMKYFGKDRAVSFVSMIASRNANHGQ